MAKLRGKVLLAIFFVTFSSIAADTTLPTKPATAYELKPKSCVVFQTLFTEGSDFLTKLGNSTGAGATAKLFKKPSQLREWFTNGVNDFLKNIDQNPARELLLIPKHVAEVLTKNGLESVEEIKTMEKLLDEADTELTAFDQLIKVPTQRSKCKIAKTQDNAVDLENKATKMAKDDGTMKQAIEAITKVFRSSGVGEKEKIAEDLGRALAYEAMQTCFVNNNLERFMQTCELALTNGGSKNEESVSHTKPRRKRAAVLNNYYRNYRPQKFFAGGTTLPYRYSSRYRMRSHSNNNYGTQQSPSRYHSNNNYGTQQSPSRYRPNQSQNEITSFKGMNLNNNRNQQSNQWQNAMTTFKYRGYNNNPNKWKFFAGGTTLPYRYSHYYRG